jgi:two-component system, response regulator YesN
MGHAVLFALDAAREAKPPDVGRRSYDASDVHPANLPPRGGPVRTAITSGRRQQVESVPWVLLVDDDAPVRSFMRLALEPTAVLIEARDGEQALQMLERHGGRIDLVLLDYVIPHRSGLEILNAVRREWPRIPVVIITGFGSEAVAIDALRAGARDYLKKPIDVDKLRQTVAALTAKRSSVTVPGFEIQSAESDAPRPVHQGIARALRYASQHFTESITLSGIAREAALSKFHFCRLFHREMGFSFREHLQGLRVRRARELLADPTLSVTEIAYAVGFNDLSTFDKMFRKRVGVPPRTYRRSILSS